MNIAIVIGVSEYSDPQNNLPGCKTDAEVIYTILNKTNKYDDILYLNELLSSAKTKEKLTDFISINKANKIDELVFYYTGHGEFTDDEFYYLLSDYTLDRKKQTTLQNEEIDNLIKTLKPELVIKIIDACQSGKTYIKEAGAVSKYFQRTQERFNRCYFLNSSLNNQSSYQSDLISDFSLSFVNAIKEHNTDEIRYKDIIDYISDEFSGNTSQTPFFIIQADYTEKFCLINNDLKAYLSTLDLSEQLAPVNIGEDSIVEKIKKQANSYYSKEQAIQLVDEIKEEVGKFQCDENLNQLYDLAITFSDTYNNIIHKDTIAKWLEENQHEYFAKSVYTEQRKYEPARGLLALTAPISAYNENDYIKVRSGFELEVVVPYKTIIFNLNTKYPNIDSYTCRIVHLLSKRQICFFYFITNLVEKNWDERVFNIKTEWFFSEFPINDKAKIIEGLKTIFDKLQNRVNKDLEEKF